VLSTQTKEPQQHLVFFLGELLYRTICTRGKPLPDSI